MNTLYVIDLPPDVNAAVIVNNKTNKIIMTAPILGWMKGKSIDFIEEWVKKKNGKIDKV